jgi:hypothetical protein
VEAQGASLHVVGRRSARTLDQESKARRLRGGRIAQVSAVHLGGGGGGDSGGGSGVGSGQVAMAFHG